MRAREKKDNTYESVRYGIERLERELADLIINNSFGNDSLPINTRDVQQKVGRLKALREVFFK